jgi:type IV fimbrial biogenesis protein FimT
MLQNKMKAQTQAGFTLLELMMAIALLAVLLSIGIPNFRDFINNARMASAANDLLGDFNFARSEAIKRRLPVTLCKSDDGATCDDDEDTQFRGWIVFIDDTTTNGIVDDDDEVLRGGGIAPEIASGTADGLFSIFLSTGFVRQDADTLRQVLFCDQRGNVVASGGDSAARGVQISATGRPVVTRNIAQITSTFGDCPT